MAKAFHLISLFALFFYSQANPLHTKWHFRAKIGLKTQVVDQVNPLPLPPYRPPSPPPSVASGSPSSSGSSQPETRIYEIPAPQIIPEQPTPFCPPSTVSQLSLPPDFSETQTPTFQPPNIFVEETNLENIPEIVRWIRQYYGSSVGDNDVIALDFDRVITTGRQLIKFKSDKFDPRAKTIIKALQSMGVKVVGTTRRAPCDLQGLDNVLDELDIDFDWLAEHTCESDHKFRKVRVSSGVMMTFWRKKGTWLKELFKKNKIPQNKMPKRRIFLVDDHWPNLETFEEAFQDDKIQFVGIFYRDPNRKRDFWDWVFEFLP